MLKDSHGCCDCLRKDYCVVRHGQIHTQKKRVLMIVLLENEDWRTAFSSFHPVKYGCLKCWIDNGENDEADPGVGTIVWKSGPNLAIFLCERHTAELRLKHTVPLSVKEKLLKLGCNINPEELESI